MAFTDEDKKCAWWSVGTAIIVVALMLIIFLWVIPLYDKDNMCDAEHMCNTEHMDDCNCVACKGTTTAVTDPSLVVEGFKSDSQAKKDAKSTKQKVTTHDYANKLLDTVDEAGLMKKNHKKWVKDLDGRYGGSAIVDDHNEALEQSVPFVGFVGRPIAVKKRGIMPFENEVDHTILPNHKAKGSSMYERIGY